MKAPENTSKPRKLFPSGVSHARLQILADLGTQLFQGKDPTRKLLFVFESTDHFDEFDATKGSEPFILMNELAFFMNSANPSKKTKLRTFVEGWRGTPFTEDEARAYDLEQLVGKPALLMVAHTGKVGGGTKAMLQGASRPHKDTEVPAMRGKPVCYEIGMKEGGTFAQLPPWIQKKVRESTEFTGAAAEESPFVPTDGGNDNPDNLPENW